MTVLQSSLNWLLDQFRQRVGNDYKYGGMYSPYRIGQGCDCSGLDSWALQALTLGPANMPLDGNGNWIHTVSTEAWPFDYGSGTPAAPGTVGPYGTISVGSDPNALPADAALWINIMHGGGGEDSHMNAVIPNGGTIMESNGDAGSCTNGNGGADQFNPEWTDHWYLPGPVVNDTQPAAPTNTLMYPDVSNNNWTSANQLTNFLSQLHAQGFAGVCHKVSEGATYQDPYWKACRAWCEANNLSWLGYHYVTTDDPAAQANNFTANNGGGNVMLDFEANSGNFGNFWAVVNAFNDANINVSLAYIPRWYWQQIGSPDLRYLSSNGIQLVSSDYETDPPGTAQDIYSQLGGDGGPGWASYGGCAPGAWQFTDKASIAGITVDCNVHHTPEADLDGFFTGQGI